MNGTTVDAVQTVLLGFLQRCFMGAIPNARATREDAQWIRECLREAAWITPADVMEWSHSKQRALSDLLSDWLVMLELRRRADPTFQFPQGELDGSTPERLAQPLLSGLGSAPVTSAP